MSTGVESDDRGGRRAFWVGLGAGLATGLGVAVGALGAASMLGLGREQPAGYIAEDGVLMYVPRVVDPWKVIGFASAERNGKVHLYRLFENGAIDYVTPHDGPRTAAGIATWTPIPIDPKLCRPIEK
ncbi:MAG: hypothetical protein K2Y21_05220 [Phycisphaerales bacterium]|nr:hypothetical protein [Phycisphaerales bacterium]